MNIETLAIHTANHPEKDTGAVAPPIHLSTTFARAGSGELPGDFTYSRAGNPNRTALETALAALEGGASALAYSSGIAAISAVFQILKPGDHVVMPDDVYHGTRDLAREMQRWGLELSFAAMTDLAQLRAAIRPETRLVFAETPSNPMLQVIDLRRVVEIAREAGAWIAVDNTWATPIFQRPLDLGADFSVHSSTKYFGGHSDVLGGALIVREANAELERLRELQKKMGAVPAPFDCWLVRRGLMTLPLRMRAHNVNAMAVADFLKAHPAVSQVFYPGLASHPGHAIAVGQMSGYGGMLSFRVHGGEAAAAQLIAGVSLFTRATSLGAVESLIEHRYKVEGPETHTPKDLLRLSVGLEHSQDLIDDLAQALDRAAQFATR